MHLRRTLALSLTVALALSPAVTAHGEEASPPVVTDDGGGRFVGTYASAGDDSPHRSGRGGGSKNSSKASSSKKSTSSKPKATPAEPPDAGCEKDTSGYPITPWACRGHRNVRTPPKTCTPNTTGQPTDPTCPAEPNRLTHTKAEEHAKRIINHLQLPTPTPQVGPDPDLNEWHLVAVGYPLWLWTEGPTTVTSTITENGLTFQMRARYRSTTFDMGDRHTKTCTTTTAYPKTTKPGTPSPTCGYQYTTPAPGDGTYTITATSHWDIDWSVATFHGTLPGTHTATRDLPVGELQTIVIK